jgi:cell division protein FtsI/penicillin-binding protein 2
MAGLSLRIVGISAKTVQAGSNVSTKSIELATLKGTIYDCKLRPITNAENEIYIAAKPSNGAIALLKDVLNPEVFESVRERMSKGKPVAVKAQKSVENTEEIKTVYVPKRYGNNSFACHIVGYLDGENNGVSGIEKAYNSLLSGEIKTPRVRFSADANGRALLGERITVEDNGIPKTGVVLTIDKDIQEITEIALDNSGAVCAAAVVLEIGSGAIRACVSRPAFDRNNLAYALNDGNSPLINRALLPFSVGSVFKPVVTAAALENGIDGSFEYNCTGNVSYNGVIFNCHNKSGHGILNMEGALANSCNTYFIALANKTGAENIIKIAEKFGFGKQSVLAEGIKSASGYLPVKEEIDSKAALANLSFGQGSLLATPFQICSMMATIANDGTAVIPYLTEGETDSQGNFVKISNYKERVRVISEETSAILKKYLRSVVMHGSGKRAGSEFVAVSGKTATAQTGKTENGKEIYNSWFAGYFPSDNPKYAIVILKENSEGGSVSCAPVFRAIAETVFLMEQQENK